MTALAGWDELARWDEKLHPRDRLGQFGAKNAGGWIKHSPAVLADAREASPEEFSKAFEAAFQGSPFAAFVNHYTPAQIREGGMTPVLAAGGKAGILVRPHGDGRIEPTAVFNTSGRRGMGLALLRRAVARYGANYIECFGPALPKMYGTVGFEDSARYPFDPKEAPPGWDYGRFDNPDYHIMALHGGHKRVAAVDDSGMDLGRIRALAAAQDPAWWDAHGGGAWAAALTVFGIDAPGGVAPSPARRGGLGWAWGEELARADFTPSQHPRDRAGKFAKKAGGGSAALTQADLDKALAGLGVEHQADIKKLLQLQKDTLEAFRRTEDIQDAEDRHKHRVKAAIHCALVAAGVAIALVMASHGSHGSLGPGELSAIVGAGVPLWAQELVDWAKKL